MTKPEAECFKICSMCRQPWETRNDFLVDPELHLVGYQTNFEELRAGLFLFNHVCMGTIAIKAQAFVNLYDGPMYKERLTESDECPGYCLNKTELRPCPSKCECAFVREVLQIITHWPR